MKNWLQRVPLHRHRFSSLCANEMATPAIKRSIPRHLLSADAVTERVESYRRRIKPYVSRTSQDGVWHGPVDRRAVRLRPHTGRCWIVRSIRPLWERARVHSSVAANDCAMAMAQVRTLQRRANTATIRKVRLFGAAICSAHNIILEIVIL